MTPWFEKLTHILQREGIAERDFVPTQFYCATIDEVAAVLISQCQSAVVFVDGVKKKCEGGQDLDACFAQIMKNAQVKFEWIDASNLLGLSPNELHASANHVEKFRTALRQSTCEAALVLGSGSLTDLVKHALYQENSNKKFISVPTALSVTAYTSAFSVLDWNGAKRTKASRNVDSTVWVKPIVNNAPHRMSRAGYGDLLAPFLAYGDWALANALGLAPNYSLASYHLLEPFFEGIRNCAESVGTGLFNSTTTECLCAALGMAGIGMSAAGETAPFSGCEHAISHALDFLRTTSGRPHVLHGEQVALASLATASLFDWFLSTPKPDVRKWRTESALEQLEVLKLQFRAAPFWGEQEVSLSQSQRKQKMESINETLQLAEKEFVADFLKKANAWQALAPKRRDLAANWQEIQNTVRKLTMRGPELEHLLQQAALTLSPENTEPRTTSLEYRWATRFAPFVRSRTSIADLVFWMGEDPAILAGL